MATLKSVLAAAGAAFITAHAADVARRAAEEAAWEAQFVPWQGAEERERRADAARAAYPRVVAYVTAHVNDAGAIAFCDDYGDRPDEIAFTVPCHVIGGDGVDYHVLGGLLKAAVPGLGWSKEDCGLGDMRLTWRQSDLAH